MTIKNYAIKITFDSASGFIGKTYIGWTADGTLKIEGPVEVFEGGSGTILASGKITQIYDKEGDKISIPYDTSFENKKATVSDGTITLDLSDKYAEISVYIEANGDILTGSLTANLKGIWSSFIDGVEISAIGNLMATDVEPEPTEPVSSLPIVKSTTRLFVNTKKNIKVNSIQKASCGLLVSTYDNDSRKNSWIVLIQAGVSKTIFSSPNETIGTPALVDGWWVFPAESKKLEPLVLINDKTAEIKRGIKPLAEYATVCLDGFIPYANPVRLCDPSGKVINSFQDFNGIVSGIAKKNENWILAIMDGSSPGIASTKGWKIAGQYPEVAVMNGSVIGFAKNGEVHLLNENGKIEKTITKTGSKAQRARVKDGLVFWTTADYDQLWVSNGNDSKMLHQWKDGDKPDGTSSGSLFNTSLTFDGKAVIVARSVTKNGYEIWKVELNELQSTEESSEETFEEEYDLQSESSESSDNIEYSQFDFVPERTGKLSYKGTGEINTFLELANGKNPSKNVSLRTWVKFTGWSRKDVGASLINKGSVGNSWAYSMFVKPDVVLYGATNGSVYANYKFLTEKWYYIRIDATKSEAKFRINGVLIPVTKQDTTKLFSANSHPLRIGGMSMAWSPPSPWYNASLNGEMADWIIEVE